MISCCEETLEKITRSTEAPLCPGFISARDCNSLVNDLIEEAMEAIRKFTMVSDVQRYCQQALISQLVFLHHHVYAIYF